MCRLAGCLVVVLCCLPKLWAEEELFSGPQVGEKLTPFKMRGVLGERAGQELDLVSDAAGQPLVIFFVQEVTRPSLGLTRLLMDYAATRANDGLHSGVVFLSGDATETENWMKRAANAMPQSERLGISVDGQEGPGAYGLNRHVALTVLIGKDNRVTANFALVQPSIQADAPRIAKEMVAVLGGGKVPSLAELGVRGDGRPSSQMDDPKLDALLRGLIRKTATPEEVRTAAEAIEAYVADKPPARQRVGSIARRIIEAAKLADYGTAEAQEYLKKWAKEFGDPAAEPSRKKER